MTEHDNNDKPVPPGIIAQLDQLDALNRDTQAIPPSIAALGTATPTADPDLIARAVDRISRRLLEAQLADDRLTCDHLEQADLAADVRWLTSWTNRFLCENCAGWAVVVADVNAGWNHCDICGATGTPLALHIHLQPATADVRHCNDGSVRLEGQPATRVIIRLCPTCCEPKDAT